MKYSKRKFIYNSCCLCLGVFAFSQISHAKKKNTILKFEGDVLLNGQKIQIDLAVKYNDKIETKSASQAVVSLDDDIFQIRENTIFELPSKNESKSVLVGPARCGPDGSELCRHSKNK